MDRSRWTTDDYARAIADVEALDGAVAELTEARRAVAVARRRYPDGTPVALLVERARTDPALKAALVRVGHAARRVAEFEDSLVTAGVLTEDARTVRVGADG